MAKRYLLVAIDNSLDDDEIEYIIEGIDQAGGFVEDENYKPTFPAYAGGFAPSAD